MLTFICTPDRIDSRTLSLRFEFFSSYSVLPPATPRFEQTGSHLLPNKWKMPQKRHFHLYSGQDWLQNSITSFWVLLVLLGLATGNTSFRTNRFSSAAKQMKNASEEAFSFVLRTGFEPVTHALEIRCLLSYIRVCRESVTKKW